MTVSDSTETRTARSRVGTMMMAAVATLTVAACSHAPGDTVSGSGPTGPAHSQSPRPSGEAGSTAIAAAAQAYVEAVNRGDLDALVAAFAPDAEVIDVTRRIRGREAIRSWARGEVIGGTLRILAVTPTANGQDLLVHWAPAGSSGWRAHYRFTVTETAIITADLQYA